MYIMTDIKYMINKHSKKIFLYIRYENVPSYYASNMCNYDHLKPIFGCYYDVFDCEDDDKISIGYVYCVYRFFINIDDS